ncbi:NAD(P)-dependent oxidoreductase [Marinicauda salina]|uniref:NAD(P)-dependent oxidoreductase n=1 Tax=Marinicauda salina TaxID=2135793 RepID=A0A2U2BWM7_9PROT|nr:NAD(P)-dependent oxidoreductase [Marinicauda salina]PWE18423.1 NAD(P)-dependent oxidoreductase [Marinicauda salina]
MTEPVSALLIGYGYVARATAAALAARGVPVTASTRSGETAAAIEAAGHRALVAGPSDSDGAAALANAAAEATHVLSSVPPGEAGDPVAPALAGVDLSGAWVGYLSTTGVYGDRGGGWAFEWERPAPGQPRSLRRRAAEQDWERLGARIFRLAGIYGPGRSALDRVRARTARRIDKPGHVFSRIHVDDIADALVRAMLDRLGAAGPFNLADDRPCAQAEVVEGAARLLDVAPPPIEPFDPGTLSPMLASFYAESRRVSNARAKAALGWRLRYPTWREGLAACLEAEG